MPDEIIITDKETICQLLELEEHPFLKGKHDRFYILSRAVEKYYLRKKDQVLYKNLKWKRMAQMLRAQSYACGYCGRPLTKRNATIDHRYAIVLGGSMNDPDNQLAVCVQCNNDKGEMDEGDFLLFLKSKNAWNENHPDDKRRDEDLAALHERSLCPRRETEVPDERSADEQGNDEQGGVASVSG